jgi:hypothetical protein
VRPRARSVWDKLSFPKHYVSVVPGYNVTSYLKTGKQDLYIIPIYIDISGENAESRFKNANACIPGRSNLNSLSRTDDLD